MLLSAIIAYVGVELHSNPRLSSPTALALGRRLKGIRQELGLTQAALAERMGQSRIALSRWEEGAQPPSLAPLHTWCESLGLLSHSSGSLIQVVDITPRLLRILRDDPSKLRDLSPSAFEKFVAERLDRMGYNVVIPSATNLRDGGIDLIAAPKVPKLGGILIAGQVKHHRDTQKTGRVAVDRLLSWKGTQFNLGLLVTNTCFTPAALWAAQRQDSKYFVRLRDFEDLKRWLQDKFWSPEDWREMPDEIEVTPGLTVRIPKAKVEDALQIWPLQHSDAEGKPLE